MFGALTGVGIWLTIGLVQPQATSALVTTFVGVWAIEWTFFAVEVAAALVYVHGWERLDARRHLAVGWIYFAASWASLVAISGILSFMLTAGAWPATLRLADAWWNPTCAPTIALRTAIAVFLAGLYALFAGSFLGDCELKSRVARWSVSRWILPAAVAIPLFLVWYIAAAGGAGVDIAETLGSMNARPEALVSAVLGAGNGGQPIVRGAAKVVLLGSGGLVLLSLVTGWLRSRRYGRLEAALLMALGLVCVGAGEWVREGLRKPWVLDRHLFVNGVGVGHAAAAEDPFAVDALAVRGVLATARFARAPEAFRPGDPTFDARPAAERTAIEDEAGREIFRLECTACHTERGHLGIRRLVAGRSVAAIADVLDAIARPRRASGVAGSWSDPGVRLSTWLGRRMPPFAGTRAEKHALAVHLARLAGDADAGLEPTAAAAGGGAVVREALRGVPRGRRSVADRRAPPRPLGARAVRPHRPPAAGARGDAAVLGDGRGARGSRALPRRPRRGRRRGGGEAMNPVLPLPDPLAPAGPPPLFAGILVTTFLLHLVAMNLLLGGALLLVGLRFGRRGADGSHRDALARTLEKAGPVVAAATVTLGVAPLLFLQVLHGRVFFTSAIVMGWLWLAIVPLAMLAYCGAYALALSPEGRAPRRWVSAAVAVLLLAVAFLQATNATRSLRPETLRAAHLSDPRGLTAESRRPDVLAALPSPGARGAGGRRASDGPPRPVVEDVSAGAGRVDGAPRAVGLRARHRRQRLRRPRVPDRAAQAGADPPRRRRDPVVGAPPRRLSASRGGARGGGVPRPRGEAARRGRARSLGTPSRDARRDGAPPGRAAAGHVRERRRRPRAGGGAAVGSVRALRGAPRRRRRGDRLDGALSRRRPRDRVRARHGRPSHRRRVPARARPAGGRAGPLHAEGARRRGPARRAAASRSLTRTSPASCPP